MEKHRAGGIIYKLKKQCLKEGKRERERNRYKDIFIAYYPFVMANLAATLKYCFDLSIRGKKRLKATGLCVRERIMFY